MKNLRKIIIFGLYSVFLLPLAYTNFTLFPWHFGKTVLFEIVVEIILILAVYYFFTNKEKKPLKFNVLDWLILLFAGILIVATIFGVDPLRSFWGDQQRAQGIVVILHFVIFYFLLARFFEFKDWRISFNFILAVALLSSFIAWISPFIPAMKGIAMSDRLSGLLGNPIFLAGYLVIPTFLSFGLFLFEKNRFKYFYLAIGVLLLASMIGTEVRGAFVGLLAGLLVIFALYIIFSQSAKIKKYIISTSLALFFLLASVFILNLSTNLFKSRLPFVGQMFNISLHQTTADTRLMAWNIALQGWQARPVIGWGPENYQTIFYKYYNPKFFQVAESEAVWDKPHNNFLDILSGTGTVGFLAYLALITSVFLFLFRIIKKSDNQNEKMFFIFLTGGVTAYLGQSFFSIETSNSLLVWFFVLSFISFTYKIKCEKQKNFFTKFILFFQRKNYLYKAASLSSKIFLGLLAVISLWLIFMNVNILKASSKMNEASRFVGISSIFQWQKSVEPVLAASMPYESEDAIFLTGDLNSFDKAGQLDKSNLEMASGRLIDIYEKYIKRNDQSFLNHYWLGQLYSLMGIYVNRKYFGRSDEVFAAAAKISPDYQPLKILMAKNYLLAGDQVKAVNLYRKLIEENPNSSDYYWYYGLSLSLAGRDNEAIKYLEKAPNYIKDKKENALYLVEFYAKKKEYDKIVLIYKRLLEEDPENSSYFASLAFTYAAMGDKINALENISRAVDLDPSLRDEALKFIKDNKLIGK